ncbi:MAG: RloB domain-containing protein, partial [Chlorobium sp.]
EYWLLLHFEEASGIATSRECSERLKRYLPEYDKGIESRKITAEMITAAIRRAEHRDINQHDTWPKETGTTVYRLVKNILHTS